jgi:hypothetical protein
MKNFDSLNFFLIIEIHHDSQSITITQTKYAMEILECSSMIGPKPVSTLMAYGSEMSKFNGDSLNDATSYYSVVRALQYLIITILYLSYAINQVC